QAVRPASVPVRTIINQAWRQVGIGSPGCGLPRMAKRTAIPTTAPIWRDVELIALPVANRARGSCATAALPKPEKERPTPAPVRIIRDRERADCDTVEVSVDRPALHFFDLQTGLAIRSA